MKRREDQLLFDWHVVIVDPLAVHPKSFRSFVAVEDGDFLQASRRMMEGHLCVMQSGMLALLLVLCGIDADQRFLLEEAEPPTACYANTLEHVFGFV